ncbi:MAG TPA: hypothetical protein VMS86_09060 [Thermoanaerobaculia bacterium]|nr:hypothetical protein [Thermoanaerobaculia bacterium]
MSETQPPTPPRRQSAAEWLAGGGIGLLVGALLGLSVSPVVATVLGALTAVIAAFFGLAGDSKQDSARLGRIAAFAFAAVVGLVTGLYLRTHDSLSVSVEDDVAEWEAAGYPTGIARGIVAYERTGLVPEGWSQAPEETGPRSASTALFSASAEDCARVDPRDHPDTEELANAFALAEGGWAELARATGEVPAEQRREILEAAWRLACEAA